MFRIIQNNGFNKMKYYVTIKLYLLLLNNNLVTNYKFV